eukprot:CAMPEP_0197073500 /NCGR_PEP_ID=MMETSP1384-20130603/210636_1 /TAXON_ID=29189 /ORGANISM="Ammonia sp." /LENGTH=122 /DNA_ID=CAMNT_0042512337 /DNA_START=606 /DNA_END=974 /DNA_ORIENTATION=-
MSSILPVIRYGCGDLSSHFRVILAIGFHANFTSHTLVARLGHILERDSSFLSAVSNDSTACDDHNGGYHRDEDHCDHLEDSAEYIGFRVFASWIHLHCSRLTRARCIAVVCEYRLKRRLNAH